MYKIKLDSKLDPIEIEQVKNLKNIYQEIALLSILSKKYGTFSAGCEMVNITSFGIGKNKYPNEEEQYKNVCQHPYWVENVDIDIVSIRVQVKCCEYDGSLIKYFKHQTLEAKMVACKEIYNMRFIHDPTSEMWKIAFDNLKLNVDNIKCHVEYNIRNTFKVLMRAVYRYEEYNTFTNIEVNKYVNKQWSPIQNCVDKFENGSKLSVILITMLSIRFMSNILLSPFKIILSNHKLLIRAIKNILFQIYNEMIFNITEYNIKNIKNRTYTLKFILKNYVSKDILHSID